MLHGKHRQAHRPTRFCAYNISLGDIPVAERPRTSPTQRTIHRWHLKHASHPLGLSHALVGILPAWALHTVQHVIMVPCSVERGR